MFITQAYGQECALKPMNCPWLEGMPIKEQRAIGFTYSNVGIRELYAR